MMHVGVCPEGHKFEWRNGELFVVSDSVCKDTAWIDSYTAELMRRHCPEAKVNGQPPKEGEFPFFIIQRLESGDLVFEVDEYVIFEGGDVLCFIKPVTKEMEVKNEIKPCPFCGGRAKKHRMSGDERNGYADTVFYRCESCFVQRGAGGDTSKPGYADNSKIEENALAAWNQRTSSNAEVSERSAAGGQSERMEG